MVNKKAVVGGILFASFINFIFGILVDNAAINWLWGLTFFGTLLIGGGGYLVTRAKESRPTGEVAPGKSGIQGRVYDREAGGLVRKKKGGISGIVVRFHRTHGDPIPDTHTDVSGDYWKELPPDTYEVEYNPGGARPEFSSHKEPAVEVKTGKKTTRDIPLVKKEVEVIPTGPTEVDPGATNIEYTIKVQHKDGTGIPNVPMEVQIRPDEFVRFADGTGKIDARTNAAGEATVKISVGTTVPPDGKITLSAEANYKGQEVPGAKIITIKGAPPTPGAPPTAPPTGFRDVGGFTFRPVPKFRPDKPVKGISEYRKIGIGDRIFKGRIRIINVDRKKERVIISVQPPDKFKEFLTVIDGLPGELDKEIGNDQDMLWSFVLKKEKEFKAFFKKETGSDFKADSNYLFYMTVRVKNTLPEGAGYKGAEYKFYYVVAGKTLEGKRR